MSASDKKKLRKEQNAAAMTEKQHTEKKEQKKLKSYTVTFIIAMVLVVAIVLVATLQAPVKNIMMKNTTAVTINEHEIDAAEFNYFFVDAISNFRSQFSGYGNYADLYMQYMTGYAPTLPLDDQIRNKETGETWADYFINAGKDSAKWTYGMYDAAMKAGFELSKEEKEAMDSVESYMALYASFYGYSNADGYVKAMYGASANLDGYMEYYEICTIASAYANKYIDGLEYTNEDYRNHEAEKYHEYCSYSYATFTLSADKYLTGGTKTTGKDGKETITYSDAEKQAARDAALADAKALLAGEVKDVETLNNAIANLEKYNAKTTATENTAILYSRVPSSNEELQKWITSSDRKAGDLQYFENTTGTGDDKTVTGYTVVLFLERIDNTMNVGTVRHLLVKFEGGKTDKTTNKTTYTEEEKNKAKAEAEKLLEEYNKGKKTEEAFIELVKKNSDDSSKSTGGLFENVTPDSGYVKPFADWATAKHEKGDVEIIETEYGYHIMYYVEANELNYRDMMIKSDLVDADYTKWEEEILKAVKVTDGNMKYVNRDYVGSVSSN